MARFALWETRQMGHKVFTIGDARQALELSCDCPSHREGEGRTWFDCGTHEGNLTLALAAGWTKRRNVKDTWACPQCARKVEGKRRSRADMQTRFAENFGV
jgi:hypothetical protein